MEEQTIIELPSGARLKITLAPFAVSKALYQALLREFRGVPIVGKLDITSLVKDSLCAAFSSPDVERALAPCLGRCTVNYNGTDVRISETTFEPAHARQDYMKVCAEVTKANVGPFGKSLYADFKSMVGIIENTQSAQSPTMPSSSIADSVKPAMQVP